jgi:hypothetical protein
MSTVIEESSPMPLTMDLDIAESFNKRLITSYIYRGRTYFLLFYKNGTPGPFYVEDAPYAENSLLSIGEIKCKADDLVIGNIFYTNVNYRCEGSFLLVYSGVFKHSINKKLPRDLNMSLWAKTPYMQIFQEKNRATLVISPMLKNSIKQNLEI